MTERVLLIEGVDYKVIDGEPVRVSAAGLATINEAHKRGALAVIEVNGVVIVEFVPKGPYLKLVPIVA